MQERVCNTRSVLRSAQAKRGHMPNHTTMQRGLYIAATGMTSAMVRQDVIANNLANVSTVGFKGDKVVNETFADSLLHSMQGGRQVMGTSNYGTRVAGTVTDFSQGALRSTQGKFDVALGGDGFFRIRQDDGSIAYTRAGEFTRSPDGFLATQAGQFVLGPDNLPVYAGVEGEPVIRPDGSVMGPGGDQLGQIGISTLDIPSAVKIGQNLWSGTETGGMPQSTQVRQGFLEASGVNSVKEMVEMITTMRAYESSQRMITAIDGTLDKAVNSVGTIG
ncbi:MAG: flagellar basal-body rod protein FlgF [Thermoleophilia bacterium]|nr:flagellar basal-body rod protein FlgF [Thermoleophilia bacterium]